MEDAQRDLTAAAREAARHSYSPYSRFAVGAALRTGDDEVFVGTNIENSSYGLTLCAEQAAVAAAITAGRTRIVEIAIWTETVKPSTPCGACRQVLAEFAVDRAAVRVTSSCPSGSRTWTLAELLPEAFRL